jgi:hypothetical protein
MNMPHKLLSILAVARNLETTPGDTDGGWAISALAGDIQRLARTILAIDAELDQITNPITPEAGLIELREFMIAVHDLLRPDRALRVPSVPRGTVKRLVP